ncbi:lipoprotein [Nitritalea halalkaliphila LW7]|uniref:Lipoprotein n=1 Tax=Nitritalea halalkaliphila LW7 TaxID=1189621 RepID=I5BZL0_9BACT|nr:copper resistance protein NlpE [Nitritalea halalkaliphila]EIM75012.1 lipoprotein [Nitritalea halalkaliphila LW7]
MMKIAQMTQISLLLLGFSFFLFACGKSDEERRQEVLEKIDALEQEAALEMAREHSARLALDYAGTYKGTLPCADCAGIQTVLQISQDGTYVKQLTYEGKSEEVFESKGTYTWNDMGNTITLEGEDAPNQYFVAEGMLHHLDAEGNRIQGQLAPYYILRKQGE